MILGPTRVSLVIINVPDNCADLAFRYDSYSISEFFFVVLMQLATAASDFAGFGNHLVKVITCSPYVYLFLT